MIQRLQSVFLFLVALAMVGAALSPIWLQVHPAQSQSMELNAWYLLTKNLPGEEIISQNSNFYIGILAIIAALLALYSLFQFKDRKKQLFLNMINALLMGVTLGTVIYVSYQANLEISPNNSGAYVFGFYCIIFALVMNLIANRFIRKDEMLIKSIDRIR